MTEIEKLLYETVIDYSINFREDSMDCKTSGIYEACEKMGLPMDIADWVDELDRPSY